MISKMIKPTVSQFLTPGFKLIRNHSRTAGLKLKNEGEEACKKFVRENEIPKDECPNFQGGPAIANIIAKSREFTEWEIYQSSLAIQEVIFTLPKDKLPEPILKEEWRAQWLSEHGLDTVPYKEAAGLNLIIKNAVNTYKGVQVKVDNKNKNNLAKINRKNEIAKLNGEQEISFEEIKAFDDKGYLLQKPSPNKSIYCYQSVSPKPFITSKYHNVNLPEEYIGYYRKSNEPIVSPYQFDRLRIPIGEPGYVPKWQYTFLSKKENKRRKLSKRIKNVSPILGIICIKKDWCVFDMRGLLRTNHWKKYHKPTDSINDLFDYFTGDPVIDTKANVVRFRYKMENGIVNYKPVREKKGKELLENICDQNGSCKLATVDVGQNNPVAIGLFELKKVNGELTKTLISRHPTPIDFCNKITAYRERYDKLESSIKLDAIKQLTSEQKIEVDNYNNNFTPQNTKQIVCSKLNINPNDLPWDKMISGTHFISEKAQVSNKSEIYFTSTDKGKTKDVMKSDYKWFQDYKPKLSKEVRDALSDIEWRLRRESLEFNKLSKSREQDARQLANWISSMCDVIGIENLVKKNNFFGGSGKREPGWDNFYKPKKEIRWWINAIHKALTELSQNKGKRVILLPAMRTSITCPKCKYCDSKNRNGEKFNCLKCGIELNADIDVATENLATVAITAQSMPKPTCERSGDAKKPVRARKAKAPEFHDKLAPSYTVVLREAV